MYASSFASSPHAVARVTGVALAIGWLTLGGCETVPDELPIDYPNERPLSPPSDDGDPLVPEETPPRTPPEVDHGLELDTHDDTVMGSEIPGEAGDADLSGEGDGQAEDGAANGAAGGLEPGSPQLPLVPAGAVAMAAPLKATSGSELTGSVRMWEEDDGVVVVVHVEGATPGEHGVHFHHVANCSAVDASSAGDHFAPRGEPHGLWDESARHLGDLGNMQVDDGGEGVLVRQVEGANLTEGAPSSFVGRALVVHERADDGTGTSGNSGARIGCAELLP